MVCQLRLLRPGWREPTLALSFEFGGLTLKSITGYASIEDQFGFDLAGGGNNGTWPAQPGCWSPPIRIWTSSARSSSCSAQLGESFDWQLGLFYLNEDGSQTYRW
jgi:hypothetical protein